ncbi:hypothetical protein D3C72_656280 [compost metagenome]
MVCSMSASRVASARLSASVCVAILRIQFKSPPAQNALPAPVNSSTRTSGSCSACRTALVSAAISASSKALRMSGRFSVRRAMAPSRATISGAFAVMRVS